eukprot:jgi/Mesvir1/23484/Mv22332-RA.1
MFFSDAEMRTRGGPAWDFGRVQGRPANDRLSFLLMLFFLFLFFNASFGSAPLVFWLFVLGALLMWFRRQPTHRGAVHSLDSASMGRWFGDWPAGAEEAGAEADSDEDRRRRRLGLSRTLSWGNQPISGGTASASSQQAPVAPWQVDRPGILSRAFGSDSDDDEAGWLEEGYGGAASRSARRPVGAMAGADHPLGSLLRGRGMVGGLGPDGVLRAAAYPTLLGLQVGGVAGPPRLSLQNLRLALTNRDFTPQDYEALLALDEELDAYGEGRSARGLSQRQIDALPQYRYQRKASKGRDREGQAGGDNGTGDSCGDKPARTTAPSSGGTAAWAPGDVANASEQLAANTLGPGGAEAVRSPGVGQEGNSSSNANPLTSIEGCKGAAASLGGAGAGRGQREPKQLEHGSKQKQALAGAGQDMAAVEEVSDELCSICLEELQEGDVMRTLPCVHAFHIACIDPWLRQQAACPVCKSPLTT